MQDLGGEDVDNVPEWTVSTAVQYDHELTDNLLGIARLEHNFSDSYYLDQDLDPNLKPEEIATELVENAGLDSVMTNSFGFGGTNGSMILSKFKG